MQITNQRYAEIAALIRAHLGPKGEPTDDAEVLADLRDESIPQSVLIGVMCDLLDRQAKPATSDQWEVIGTVHTTDADRALVAQFDRSRAAHADCPHSHKFGGDYEHDHRIAAKINDALTGWRERHTDCGHPLDPRTLLACDYDEAYRITAELIEA